MVVSVCARVAAAVMVFVCVCVCVCVGGVCDGEGGSLCVVEARARGDGGAVVFSGCLTCHCGVA